jgi:mono/diheme cytochrome c family protein
MNAFPRWTWIAIGIASVLTVLAVAYFVILSRSEAILAARYWGSPSTVHAVASPDALTRGAHLTLVTNCSACHGKTLSGRGGLLSSTDIPAPNLTIVSKTLSDAAMDRAIRQGLRPDGTSELGMPSQAYASFTEDEVAAIIVYLRALKPEGVNLPHSPASLRLRANLATGAVKPEVLKVALAKQPVEVALRFQPGRHLAMVACGQCHGTDLRGGRGLPGPDLTLRGYYDRGQFRTLMRTGVGISEDMDLMSRTALASFSHFTDTEVDAIYDYLISRDQALSAEPHP